MFLQKFVATGSGYRVQWLRMRLCCVRLDGRYNDMLGAARDVEARMNRGLCQWPRGWLTQAAGDSFPGFVYWQNALK